MLRNILTKVMNWSYFLHSALPLAGDQLLQVLVAMETNVIQFIYVFHKSNKSMLYIHLWIWGRGKSLKSQRHGNHDSLFSIITFFSPFSWQDIWQWNTCIYQILMTAFGLHLFHICPSVRKEKNGVLNPLKLKQYIMHVYCAPTIKKKKKKKYIAVWL